MKKSVSILCLCTILFSSCIGGFGFAYTKHLTGNYYITATDIIEDCALSFHNKEMDGPLYARIIDQTVFSAGYNDDYLIVKQCDISYRETGKSFPPWAVHERVKNNIRYYIVPVKEEINWRTDDDIFLGPFTLEEFEQKRAELGISDLQFTVEVDM